jgi:glycerol-3-phosphate acyltransferase PlsY
MQNNLITLSFLLLFSYLLGSIPFGLILVKLFQSEDIRKIGSGNIGATNVRRAAGWGLAFVTLACDVMKGAVPVYMAGHIAIADTASRDIWMSLTASAAFCGHLFPVYLKFKTGGKGVATAAGCFAVISWPALVIALLVFTTAVGLSKRVSLGSISAAMALPLGVLWTRPSMALTGCALIISALVLYRHRDNIQRLMSGNEPPLWGQ